MTRKRENIEFSESFCLRTPFLSLDFFEKLVRGDTITDQQLTKYWSEPRIREMISLASPSLYQALIEWEEKVLVNPERLHGIKKAFVRYLIRSSSRCTPFGLCGGVGMGKLSHIDQINICPERHKRRTRLDMFFMDMLLNKINEKDRNKLDLHFHLNTSLYQVGDEYRFLKYVSQKKGGREYSITGINKSAFLDQIVEFIGQGKRKNKIFTFLYKLDVEPEEAANLLDQLISSQFIVSELEVSVLGHENLERILWTGLINEENSSFYNSLTQIEQGLKALDKALIPKEVNKENLLRSIDQLDIEYDPRLLLQCDLFLETENAQIKKKYGYQIGRLITKLSAFHRSTPNHNLDAFKSAFTDRYESQEIPLSIALDVDIGIGYLQDRRVNNTTTFLDDIKHATRTTPSTTTQRRTFLESQILVQTNQALLDNVEEVKLDLNADIYNSDVDSRGTLMAMFEVVKDKDDQRIFVKNIGGSSGANLLGRFAYGSTAILGEVQEICKFEEKSYSEAIVAEIHHLPGTRTGNVLQRPSIRSHHITYLSHNSSSTPAIPLDDLRVSVSGGRVKLRSTSLEKEIIPRLTNAHNYSQSTLPIYRFLCDVQHQNRIASYMPSFETLFSRYFYTPRVSLDGILLHKASWRLRSHHLEDCKTMDHSSRYTWIKKWIKEKRVPRRVQIVQSDNLLTLDLNNDFCLEILYDTIQTSGGVRIQEYMPTAPIVKDQHDQCYAHEFLLNYRPSPDVN